MNKKTTTLLVLFITTLLAIIATTTYATLLSSSLDSLESISSFSTTSEDLNPDDFDRMDIDVPKEVERLSQFPVLAQPGTHSRYAYVLIHYEGTPNDDLYVLGTRVVIRSILETGTKQDIVIVCANNVRESTIELFKRDGAKIKMVPNIPNPYKKEQQNRRTYKSRFEFTFNKLYMWNMHEYERVIYNDADNLITRNIDELFLCGAYCVTFFNPLFFHTGMMVVKPDSTVFKSLLKGLLSLEVFSYDGADQGFLTAAFPGIEQAPLFNPSRILAEGRGVPSPVPLMRFPLEYNFNAVFYDGAMSFDNFRQANLPFSYMAYDQAKKTGIKIVPESAVISPYSAAYPPLPEPKDVQNGVTIYNALTASPASQMDYNTPVGSIDYPLPVAFKPWNYIPYIFFHTCRFWSPIRNRIEAIDLSKGFLPYSHDFFLQGLNFAVLPLIILPFVLNIIARLIPFMDDIRRFARTIVRFTGTTIPAVISVIVSLLFTRSLLALSLPLATRPELAFICVFLTFILTQFNLAHFCAIILSPPCPDMFKGANNSLHGGNSTNIPESLQVQHDGLTQLEEIGIYRTPLYGITWSQLKQFFRSFGTVDFITSRLARSTLDVPFGFRSNSTPSRSATSKISSSVMLDQDSTIQGIHNVNGGASNDLDSDRDDDDFDIDDEDASLDIDFVLQECDFQANLTTGVMSTRQKTESFLGEIKSNLSNAKSKKNTAPQTKSQSYQLLGKNGANGNNNNQHQRASDDVDLDLDMMDSDLDGGMNNDNNGVTTNHLNKNDNDKLDGLDGLDDFETNSSSASSKNKKNNNFISPTQQDRMIRSALKKTAPTTLGASLSLRGGIYPSLMIIHLIIVSIMVLNLAKYGTYSNFIAKISYLVGFLLVLITYCIVFINKIMQIALGDATSLGKIYL